ncbi:hypothetical protein ATCCBAA256_41590 [Mycobacterium montefiorense]|nr:hypothetical protein ATCCBAA256_41590 [Mycobacterium montefiorense]
MSKNVRVPRFQWFGRFGSCALPSQAPLRGTTLGRDCTTWGGLAPARPTMPVGLLSPTAVRAATGMPLVDPVGGAETPAPPAPAIAELTIGAGVDPCHTGGTDIAPTSRALPRPAVIEEPQPPPLPTTFIDGAVELMYCDALAAATFEAPASDAMGAAPCESAIIGDINALAGYTPIWATDINDDTGADETIDPTWVSAD